MRYTKTEKIIFVDIEIIKSEQFLIDHPNCSPDLKYYYNHRVDMFRDIKQHLDECKTR